jgi:hypothetical protein
MWKCWAHVDGGRKCPRNATRFTGLCGKCHGITDKWKQCTQPIAKKRPLGKHCGRPHKTLQEIEERKRKSGPQTTQQTPPRRRKPLRAVIKTVAVVTITAGAVTVTLTLTLTGAIGGSPSTGDRSLSVQVEFDLKEALHELATAGWLLSANSTSNSGPSYHSDCAKSATRRLRLFLSPKRCEQYATTIRAVTKHGVTSLVAISWVEMRTTAWADQYKKLVDEYGTGNPPGVSLAFNGRCYASGPPKPGKTVWTVEVQPTGDVTIDREILQAAARTNLSPRSLQRHCPI